MPAISHFDDLQARQNAIFGHRPTSAQSVFDSSPTSNRTFDTFGEMLANDGSDKNREFFRQYGNGDGNGAVEIIKNG